MTGFTPLLLLAAASWLMRLAFIILGLPRSSQSMSVSEKGPTTKNILSIWFSHVDNAHMKGSKYPPKRRNQVCYFCD